MKRILALLALGLFITVIPKSAFGQSLGNAGTIEGAVTDPSGAAVPNAQVTIHNALTAYHQAATSGPDGTFRFTNLPPNPYHLEVTASGFSTFARDVTVRSAVPIQVKAALSLAGAQTSVNVEATGADLLEIHPSAHCRRGQEPVLQDPRDRSRSGPEPGHHV